MGRPCKIGFFTTGPALMEQINAAPESLSQTAFLELDICRHDQYQDMYAGLKDKTLDLLFFDMERS